MKGIGNKVRLLFYLTSHLNPIGKSIHIPLTVDNDTVREALRFVRSTSRTIKRLLFTGIIKHKKRIAEEEFLLRRICTLSLYTFAILSILAKFNYAGRADVSDKWITYLAYILEEAKDMLKSNNCLEDSKKDKLIVKIVDREEKNRNVE